MTSAELDEIEARTAKATPGPWRWVERSHEVSDPTEARLVAADNNDVLCAVGYEADGIWAPNAVDGAFVVNARSDVPALVAEVRRLRAALEAAKIEHRRDMGPDADGDCSVLLEPPGACDCGVAEHNRKIDEALV